MTTLKENRIGQNEFYQIFEVERTLTFPTTKKTLYQFVNCEDKLL